MPEPAFNTIDAYIAQFPPEVATRLQELRETIHSAAPDATEKISWQMPTFYLHGNLVHFAAAKHHIGFYPGADGIAFFQDRFTKMKLRFSKGAVQLPNDKPLPRELITDIVAFRAGQNREEAASKTASQKKQPGI
jgi:uncharacterized protein YdhG (YjbR/CyaY superfamily)